MSANTDISKLDDLIITLIDSVKGYEHSAEHADSDRLTEFFTHMAWERRQAIDRLQATSRALGGTPADYGSTAATLHRRWEDLRLALGGGDATVLKEVERGEDYLKAEFERAIADEHVSEPTRAAMRDVFDSVRRGHDAARALRDELAAA